jgi:hypothetical protein
MKQDRKQTELKDLLWKRWCGAGQMASMEQPRQAKRPLHGMLPIMVTRIDRLVVLELAAKTLFGPLECPGHKVTVTTRENGGI